MNLHSQANRDEVSFSTSPSDGFLIESICRRARPYVANRDRMSVFMDITACHVNGCPLRLAALLDANDFDFVHDITGIIRHLDRSTGKLTDHFRPRYAQAIA